MKIPIVNRQDRIIAYKDRDRVEKNDIYRVAALWVSNERGDILLARRAWTKKHNPGMWGPAVAGTVEKGETYRQNIIKEAREEIGLKSIKPKAGKKEFREQEHRYFVQLYHLVENKNISEFKIQKKEVAEIRWWPQQDLVHALKRTPAQFLRSISKWREHIKQRR